jgi:hypothetical protein
VYYDIGVDCADGIDPFACSFSTKAEAEAKLRKYRTTYPTAFVFRAVWKRCGERITLGSLRAV